MLQKKIIDKAFGAEFPLKAATSRCVRMRYNKNTCPICTQACKSDAISFNEGVVIDSAKCTLCMTCASECPSGCFEIANQDFFNLLAKLRKISHSVERPVLGCKKARDIDANEKTVCMGFLSDEHLIALSGFLDKPLYLNLTACAQCENSFIVEKLKHRVKSANAGTFFNITAKIKLIENKKELVFEDVTYDRRSFFKALKNMSFMHASELFNEKDAEIIRSYTAKKLPLKRELLNILLKKVTDDKAVTGILGNYAYTVRAGSSCTNCFACIGMCPTGALKIKRDGEGTGLLFNSSLCNGCALCMDFCHEKAVSVSKGFAGSNFFEYDVCNPDSYIAVAAV